MRALVLVLLAACALPAAAQLIQSREDRVALRLQVERATQLIDERKFEEGEKLLADAWNRGYTLARWIVGMVYAEGIGTPVDASKAATHLIGPRDSRSEAEAAYSLGSFYETGFWIEAEERPLLAWALQRSGITEEAVRAFFDRQPIGSTYAWSDWTRALDWYRKAAGGGHIGASVNLARLHFNPQGPRWDCGEAMRWLRPAAEKGDPTALHNMGYAFLIGPDVSSWLIGVQMESVPQGIRLVEVDAGKPAARAGLAAGDLVVRINDGVAGMTFDMSDLAGAVSRSQGRGISLQVRRPNRADRTVQVYPEHSLRRCPGAEAAGLKQDDAEAARWFQKGADAGHPSAVFHLAQAYRAGKGLARDLQKAVALLTQNASNGDWQSAQALAHMYGSGEGVERDKAMSEKWFRTAVQLKHLSQGR
jgi:TPR repeat protein